MNDSIRKKLDMYMGIDHGNEDMSLGSRSESHLFSEGDIQLNDQGSCLVIEHKYHISYLHGGYPLGKALAHDPYFLGLLSKESNAHRKISDFMFLDIETTGLSRGAGTVAFLIGTGFFKDEYFVLRQYFMRDFDDEPAVLYFLNTLLSDHKGLVTFNGKSFDWNILFNRYTYNRMKPLMNDPIHIDLLYPSRRLWRSKLESCRLSSLEENILGEFRVNDIAGELIPSAYFEFLDNRCFDTMGKVIEHNRNDVLSMVSLLNRICSIMRDPLNESDCEYELLGVGSILKTNDEQSKVLECFEVCADSDNRQVNERALKIITKIYKRCNDYEKAVKHWNEHLHSKYSTNCRIYSMVELAKFYEHKKKDFSKALSLTENAISSILSSPYRNIDHYNSLKKRRDRLQRKLALSI